jgi:hypothetical protein
MSTALFSRKSPSPRYRELLGQYRDMHVRGEQHHQTPPEQTFAGQSLPRHARNIKQLIHQFQARTLLDYGSGKGAQYGKFEIRDAEGRTYSSIPAYWGVESLTCYDPGYEPFSELPSGRFDGVLCTDVLEHCPESDLPWIVDELFSYARRFVYANVACYPARKRLANGENAHCTIQSTAWWQDLIGRIAMHYPEVRHYFLLDQPVVQADGRQEIAATVIQG